ncbi:MAG: hypothetical protein J0I17_08280 ['Candidatus Kapabacteria' thiocyanatum]|uniref:Uncharacterized protein n=1 Tax=Candidatus Kapaibacterium thiocyanatum TaxID=1895771 RepID=A0A1M3L1W8_9BACT|nr:hypothetical protein ['Candidatus Kapabacteria' thiocyanatum]OJX59234.1 MAG: hypothetical protein BGO89_02100 ['Candidatus Kapabacteria' thiocyanatum]
MANAVLYTLIITVIAVDSMAFDQTHLRGQVNRYGRVLAVDTCLKELVVDPVAGFRSGDEVLIHQVKSSGTGIMAGIHELAVIDTIDGNRIYLRCGLLNVYDVSSVVQVVRMMVCDTCIVDDVVMARRWDGTTGGVVAIRAVSSMVLSSAIDVSHAGFRGGMASRNSIDTSGRDDFCPDDCAGGRKGETSVRLSADSMHGRRSVHSAGGGGIARNGGGGGGALGGAGGRGGGQTTEYPSHDAGGRGGESERADRLPSCLTFGGGGGGGHQNDHGGSAGSAGGGCILLIAPVIDVRPGAMLRASGGDADTALSDGAGGGGAGGMVVIHAGMLSDRLYVVVRGGAGGYCTGTKVWYAPGGGGGGGAVVSTRRDMYLLSVDARGGSAGRFLGTADGHGAYGPTTGGDGIMLVDSVIGKSERAVPTMVRPRIEGRTILEHGEDTVKLSLVPQVPVHRWSTGDTTPVIRTASEGKYWADVISPGGCVVTSDTVVVRRAHGVTIHVADCEGRPGDTVDVELRIRSGDVLGRATVLRFDVRTRATMLVPLYDPRLESVLDGREIVVRAGIELWGDVFHDTTVKIPFIVVLGDSLSCAIRCVDASVSGNVPVRTVRDGRFRLLDPCIDLRSRLFDPVFVPWAMWRFDVLGREIEGLPSIGTWMIARRRGREVVPP